MGLRNWCLLGLFIALLSCSDSPLNDPHSHEDKSINAFYASFTERPKTLDPAKAFTAPDYAIIAQVYEPPLQYHYLKEPFELIPLTARGIPEPRYWDKKMQPLPASVDPTQIAYTSYDIKIKPQVFFQPHPAFTKNKQGEYRYLAMSPAQIRARKSLHDFSKHSTRELTADDFIYQIKRLASPKINSPIQNMMEKHIVGFRDFNQKMVANPTAKISDYEIQGVKKIDKYTYRIVLYGQYPQFLYWLAIPFFSPMAWEVVEFYNQSGMAANNLSLNWFPVGTGPYMLTTNNPNRMMLLERNPNFRGESLKEQSEMLDKPLGQVDRFIYRLETESIPQWNKFLQGYYDVSAIASNNFDSAIQMRPDGLPMLTSELQKKGITLQTNVEKAIFYMGFNMLDPIVGGNTQRARYLRRAIGIAFDFDEYVTIFRNGRGQVAHGPIPPGLFGYREGKKGINPYLFDFKDNKVTRRSLREAKQLLTKAGYKNGIDPRTGKPLILYFDTSAGVGPDEQSLFRWYRKQFSKLGIDLHIRATQFNRFQEKLRTGNLQLFLLGWIADYPDPENFLFLFDSENAKVKHGGENHTNYHNAEFDRLFRQMKVLPNSPARQKLIDQMVAILRYDSPIIFGFYPKTYELSHAWTSRPNLASIINNTAKYREVDPILRTQLQNQWNQPIWWPLYILAGVILIIFAGISYRFWQHRQRTPLMLPRPTEIKQDPSNHG